jgi:ubiquinone/menaquinone biosynthesis C-methylase UbiE
MKARPVPAASASFDAGATGYEATMAPSLRPIAGEVVRRAQLQPGERVLDIGTGTGIGAAASVGEGRKVVGVDGAPGMLQIARAQVPGAAFAHMDFHALDFPDGSFDVCISVHALLFAEDRVAALREWRRVTARGGRISLSVPGPDDVTPGAIYGEIYERYGIDTTGRYPDMEALAQSATRAGWKVVSTDADPTTAIRLRDDAAFNLWRQVGSRGTQTAGWAPERHAALTAEMLAVTPRAEDGSLSIPFGALYLTARNGRS